MNACDLKGKAVVFLGDGMADLPIPELDGKTPLEAVPTPTMDKIAANGASGTFLTLPEGYTVEQLPARRRIVSGMPSTVSVMTSVTDNVVTLSYRFDLGTLICLPQDYADARAYWTALCNLSRQTIVIKKS